MKRYISTLSVSTALCISVRIIISYYSQTRKKSQRYYDTVTIRVGPSVVQISNVPLVELVRTLRVTLTACVLLPYYIGHAARLDPAQERLSDSLRKAATSWKVKNLMRRLSKKSILLLMEESITSTALVFGQLRPCRISVPYCPDSRLLTMTIVLRLLEFFALCTQRQKELQDMMQRQEQFQQEAQQQMQKAQADAMAPIYKKLDDAIKAVGAAEGVIYIFDLARTPVAYVNESQSINLTPKVKTQLGIK